MSGKVPRTSLTGDGTLENPFQGVKEVRYWLSREECSGQLGKSAEYSKEMGSLCRVLNRSGLLFDLR